MNRPAVWVLALGAALPCATAELPPAARDAVLEAKQDGKSFEQREALFERALGLLTGSEHRRDQRAIRLELADIDAARGRYSTAIEIDDKVAREASAAADAELQARALDRKGYAYRELGDFSAALEAHELARKLDQQIEDPYLRRLSLARTLNNVGAVESRMAEEAGWQYHPERAMALFEQAINDLEAGRAAARPLVAEQEARTWALPEFLEVKPKERLAWIGGTLSAAQLALRELQLGNSKYLAGAEESARQAVQDAPEGSQARASALHFYARVLARQEHYAEAHKALDEAEAIWLKTSPPFYRLAYAYQVRAGEIYAKQPERRLLALDYYEKARAVHLDNGRCNDVATLDFLAGRTLEQLGRKEDAKRRYIASVELYERLRQALGAKERLEFFATRLRPYEALIRLLHESWRNSKDASDAEVAFAYSERARARSLLDTLEAEQERGDAGPKPPAGDPGACGTKLPKSDLKTAERAGLSVAQSITAKQVAAAMRPGDVLVEYFIGEDAAYAFVLADGKLDIVPLATSKRDLTLSMLALNGPFEEVGRRGRYEPLADYDLAESHRLYRAVLEPLEPRLREAKRLIVVPHRNLFYLPLDALVSDLKGVVPGDRTPSRFKRVEYFVDRAPPTRYALSAAVLYLMQSEKRVAPASGKVLAILNPPTPGQDLASLAGFEEIWKPLAAQFKGVIDGRGALGTPELFFRESGSSDLVLLGVHGVFREDVPLQSRMLLAGGAVTAQEILERAEKGEKIPARLFTLAACQLGRGQLREGEGIVGMTRVLQIAGTERIVAALWPVDVKPTTDLMVSFYDQIARNGEEQAESALLAAKRIVRKESTPRGMPVPLAHPFFWGAFVMH